MTKGRARSQEKEHIRTLRARQAYQAGFCIIQKVIRDFFLARFRKVQKFFNGEIQLHISSHALEEIWGQERGAVTISRLCTRTDSYKKSSLSALKHRWRSKKNLAFSLLLVTATTNAVRCAIYLRLNYGPRIGQSSIFER